MYYFIILLHLISSFSHTRPLVIPYFYVSFESIGWILLSLLPLDAILLTSSVLIYCFLKSLYDFLWDYPHQVYFFSSWFILFSSWVASKCLWSSSLSFYFDFHWCRPLNSYMFLVWMWKIQFLLSHLIHLSLIQLSFYFFLLDNGLFNS